MAAIILVLVMSGCFSYTILLTVDQTEQRSEVSGRKVAAAAGAVAGVARTFGLTPDPNLALLRRDSEKNDLLDYRLIALYWRERQPDIDYGRVAMSLGIDKKTGRLVVSIRDLNHGAETDFTRRLEDALTRSLSARLPSHRVEVQRTKEGPNFWGL